MPDQYDDLFYTVNGVEHCDEVAALAILLRDEVLFANEREYLHDGKPAGSTVVLYVLCNDLFAWACADAEDLPFSEIGPLVKAHLADPDRGAMKWCCKRRNQRPQPPIERKWREAGAWDDEMEALPPNTMDAETQAIFAEVARQAKERSAEA